MSSKTSWIRAGRIHKKSEKGIKIKRRQVLKMMAVMQKNSNSEVPKEFLETGRTGRRNAMPDILHPQGAESTTADLPDRLQQLVTRDPDDVASASSMPAEKQCERLEDSELNLDNDAASASSMPAEKQCERLENSELNLDSKS